MSAFGGNPTLKLNSMAEITKLKQQISIV